MGRELFFHFVRLKRTLFRKLKKMTSQVVRQNYSLDLPSFKSKPPPPHVALLKTIISYFCKNETLIH